MVTYTAVWVVCASFMPLVLSAASAWVHAGLVSFHVPLKKLQSLFQPVGAESWHLLLPPVQSYTRTSIPRHPNSSAPLLLRDAFVVSFTYFTKYYRFCGFQVSLRARISFLSLICRFHESGLPVFHFILFLQICRATSRTKLWKQNLFYRVLVRVVQ